MAVCRWSPSSPDRRRGGRESRGHGACSSRRRSSRPHRAPTVRTRTDRDDVRAERAMAAAAVVGGDDDDDRTRTAPRPGPTTASSGSSSWVFLLAATTIVARHRPVAAEPGGDLRAAGARRRVRPGHPRPAAGDRARAPRSSCVEGSVAITVATLLVALTGGVDSPFFFIVPADRRWGGPRRTADHHARAGRDRGPRLPAGRRPRLAAGRRSRCRVTIATVGINLTAMILLAYVAMVIAREQRRSRDAAIRLSTIDPLTTLFNRGFFFAALEREIARSARSGPRVLPADDGSRRAQDHQRPARPLPRRPRAARRRRRS